MISLICVAKTHVKIIDKIMTKAEVNYGFDAQNEVYGDMLKEGIVEWY